MKTYYDTLQVSRHASSSVIKAAYRALSQRHHPDKNPGSIEIAQRNMKRLNEAYEVLADPQRRKAYDSHIEQTEFNQREMDLEKENSKSQPNSNTNFDESDAFENSSKEEPLFKKEEKIQKDTNWLVAFGPVLALFIIIGMGFVVAGKSQTNSSSSTSAYNSDSKNIISQTSKSKYAACVGSYEQAKCERDQDALAKETAVEANIRAKKLDADRQKAMQAVQSTNRLPPVPVEVKRTTKSEKDEALRSIISPNEPWRFDQPATAQSDNYSRIRDYKCKSTVKLNLNSSNYSGAIDIELRAGVRPGSNLIEKAQVFTSGTVRFTNICPGTYFLAFATPNSDIANTTRYFEVEQTAEHFSMPELTVTYTSVTTPGSQKVGISSKKSL